jgi:hypothetical protein
VAKAPISPNDCRELAAKCIRLLDRAHAPRLKRALRERAAIWMKLAIELERAEALTADMPEPKPKMPTR